MRILFFGTLLSVSFLLRSQNQASPVIEPENNDVGYSIIQSPDSSWAYDIIVDGEVIIHQPIIPGISGKRGFASKEDAAIVARLVVDKIKNGIMPPGISLEEIEKSGISLE